jgi:hypothetical protein
MPQHAKRKEFAADNERAGVERPTCLNGTVGYSREAGARKEGAMKAWIRKWWQLVIALLVGLVGVLWCLAACGPWVYILVVCTWRSVTGDPCIF